MVAETSKVIIVILTYNQRDVTLRCLTSLTQQCPAGQRILVWDNGSSDGTFEAVLRHFPKVQVHKHRRNLGVASGRNAAARLAMRTSKPTHLLFLDNDMTVAPGFMDALLAPFSKHSKLAQTEAKIRFMDDPERLNAAGGSRICFSRGSTQPVGYGEIDRGQYDQPRRCLPNGGATLVRADLFLKLDGFDPIFDPYGPEDLDFSLRVQKAGYFGLYVPAAVVYHDHHRSVEGGTFNERYAANKARHWLVFMRRHASLLQQLGFYLWGAPRAVLRVLVREGVHGNLGALRGLWKGYLRALK